MPTSSKTPYVPQTCDSIGKRLRAFMTLNRTTVRAFSERFGVPYRTVEQYLADRAKPGADALTRLAEGGIDVNWLLTGGTKPRLILDLSSDAELRHAHGKILADQGLVDAIMREATALIDEMLSESPEVAARVGVTGTIKAVWQLFEAYVTIFEQRADQIEKARREGWETDDIMTMIAGKCRDTTRAALRQIVNSIIAEVREPPCTPPSHALGTPCAPRSDA